MLILKKKISKLCFTSENWGKFRSCSCTSGTNVDVKRAARRSPAVTWLRLLWDFLLWCSEDTSLAAAIPPSLLEILIIQDERVDKFPVTGLQQPLFWRQPALPYYLSLSLCLCLTLDSAWLFWSRHRDSSAAFGSVMQRVRGGTCTAGSSLALLGDLLPGRMPEHGPLVDGQLHGLWGRGLSRGRLWTELVNSSGWCASTVAWSNPIKEGGFFF